MLKHSSIYQKQWELICLMSDKEPTTEDPYFCLIRSILSIRAKDKISIPCVGKLLNLAPNVESMLKLKKEEITNMIYPIGLSKIKTNRIIETSKTLISKYKGVVPSDVNLLMNFPGVGLKVASVVRHFAFNIPDFPVDTY
ncbi:2095_t:CDS:1 [Entrophospora sp. SA101]|nr:10669_t:CDS:1 [Entrophospora sp. SA101]CAJ0882308.1 2095_t:CDS:1 [Entrophospora sp. SA101]